MWAGPALGLGDRATESNGLSRHVLTTPLEGTPFICIGWRLLRQHWGQGFASEASHAVLDQALRVLRIDPVAAIVDPRNTASIRVAEKIGMRRVGTTYHYGTDQILSGLTQRISADRGRQALFLHPLLGR